MILVRTLFARTRPLRRPSLIMCILLSMRCRILGFHMLLGKRKLQDKTLMGHAHRPRIHQIMLQSSLRLVRTWLETWDPALCMCRTLKGRCWGRPRKTSKVLGPFILISSPRLLFLKKNPLPMSSILMLVLVSPNRYRKGTSSRLILMIHYISKEFVNFKNILLEG